MSPSLAAFMQETIDELSVDHKKARERIQVLETFLVNVVHRETRDEWIRDKIEQLLPDRFPKVPK